MLDVLHIESIAGFNMDNDNLGEISLLSPIGMVLIVIIVVTIGYIILR